VWVARIRKEEDEAEVGRRERCGHEGQRGRGAGKIASGCGADDAPRRAASLAACVRLPFGLGVVSSAPNTQHMRPAQGQASTWAYDAGEGKPSHGHGRQQA
jgi:hypothetical protein